MNHRASRNAATAILLGILFFHGAVFQHDAQTQTNISITQSDLAVLFDPIVADQMAKSKIPGAAIAIVKDGKVLFTKGYGYADIEKKTPVVPEKTIFRIGSITKVFTAVAVMQMADRGQIKLKD